VHFTQNRLNLSLGKFAETRVSYRGESNFDIAGLEVGAAHSLEHLNSALDCLLRVPVTIVLFELLFKLGHSFLVLGTRGNSLVTNALPARVYAVHSGTLFEVAADEGDDHAEGTHARVLTELLQVGGEVAREDSDGHLV
jgi:hypothetical protein